MKEEEKGRRGSGMKGEVKSGMKRRGKRRKERKRTGWGRGACAKASRVLTARSGEGHAQVPRALLTMGSEREKSEKNKRNGRRLRSRREREESEVGKMRTKEEVENEQKKTAMTLSPCPWRVPIHRKKE